ncbi:hypothetical protein DESC_690042 [Desulfosarcina cetonica]|nr:hypothetical protein DESC_690042 [Desulfosarcina cetonica]
MLPPQGEGWALSLSPGGCHRRFHPFAEIRGHGGGAGGQFPVEHHQSLGVVLDPLELGDNVVVVFLFLDLFGHIPFEKNLGGVILLGNRHFHEIVDRSGDELLVGQCLGEHIQRGFKRRGRRLNGGQLHFRALALDVFEELHGVQHLLMILDHEPVGESLEANLVAVGRHGHVKVGGIHFAVDLFVQRLGHFIANHGWLLFSVADG